MMVIALSCSFIYLSFFFFFFFLFLWCHGNPIDFKRGVEDSCAERGSRNTVYLRMVWVFFSIRRLRNRKDEMNVNKHLKVLKFKSSGYVSYFIRLVFFHHLHVSGGFVFPAPVMR